MKDRPVPGGLAARTLAIAALTLALCAQPLWSAQPRVLEPSPGPIDKPLHVVAADFDRDGFDDLAIANFQAGSLLILINQCDCGADGLCGTVDDLFCGGHFVQHPESPELTGGASFVTPTGAPLHLSVVDFNPEDVDSDQILNINDNCPNVSNPIDPLTGLQTDSDGNGVGDECQVLEDIDGDGIPETPIDSDGDGLFDYDPDFMMMGSP
ncbi:MAG: thrombospondin type 3 repeat-containing protein, partial [Acidobacteriota bacterium]